MCVCARACVCVRSCVRVYMYVCPVVCGFVFTCACVRFVFWSKVYARSYVRVRDSVCVLCCGVICMRARVCVRRYVRLWACVSVQ